MPSALPPLQLLGCVLLIVIGLVLLISRWRMPAFIALILASLLAGACGGLGFGQIVTAFQEGVGNLLGSIAIVIGLGAVLGKLLAESGGAQQIAGRLLASASPRRLPWTMLWLGFLVGIPVFFGVGLVLLAPILYAVRANTKLPFLQLAIPLVAGLSAAHGLVPPHPGPMVAIGLLKANVGKTVIYSLVIGSAAAILSGPVLGKICGFWNDIAPGSSLGSQFAVTQPTEKSPRFWPTLLTILLPVLLMSSAAVTDLLLAEGHPVRKIAGALGTPLGAMLVATLVSLRVFGTARGFSRQTLLKFTEESLTPIASILLVIGAGGGFSKVLVASGVGTGIAEFAREARLSPILFGWLAAALVRVATGSATVAITTAAGLLQPLVAGQTVANPELLVLAMGAGSLVLSHVNDGGFWFVKEYLGLSVAQTLKTWTVMETALSITGLILVLVADRVLH